MGDDAFNEIMGHTLLPVIKKKFEANLKTLVKSFEEKDFELYKDTLMKFYVLAKTSKPFVGLEPFEEVFDKCGLLLYLEGDELKFIQKTVAGKILYE